MKLCHICHGQGKEYLVKYKSCHHKEVMWMKLAILDHLTKMVNKFDHERGYEHGVKRTRKKKKKPTYNLPKC
jgi:hypothetical protein